MFFELKRHIASLGAVERLQVWRAGGVHSAQGETLAVVQILARQMQNLRANLGDVDQQREDHIAPCGRGENGYNQRTQHDCENKPETICDAPGHAFSRF
jgi:hypothetical protein